MSYLSILKATRTRKYVSESNFDIVVVRALNAPIDTNINHKISDFERPEFCIFDQSDIDDSNFDLVENFGSLAKTDIPIFDTKQIQRHYNLEEEPVLIEKTDAVFVFKAGTDIVKIPYNSIIWYTNIDVREIWITQCRQLHRFSPSVQCCNQIHRVFNEKNIKLQYGGFYRLDDVILDILSIYYEVTLTQVRKMSEEERETVFIKIMPYTN